MLSFKAASPSETPGPAAPELIIRTEIPFAAASSKIGKRPELTEYLVEGSFGAGQKELQEKCLEVIQREEKLPQAIVEAASLPPPPL